MATRESPAPGACALLRLEYLLTLQILALSFFSVNAQVLTPPYFNLAQGRPITATATCGVDVPGPELYCRLTGATGERDEASKLEVIQGQLCDYCNPELSHQDHRSEYATDGTERWWQSPPLSRGVQYNQINLTIHLGQEFHVAYVFIRMANSPRPAVWVLERSTNFGETWEAWQYFADTPSDCNKFFRTPADQNIFYDDQVLCVTEFSKVVPLEGGEIVVSLVNGRPNAENFSNTDVLQQWTKATDVRMRLIRTKTLLGHLMAIERQDPTVTRRYYYSIKDISIGGRCVCNGHAETCDRPPELDTNKLLCSCVHNTCGEQCEYCCPGFLQKRWRRARVNDPFVCEPCQCYGHSTECIFDETVEYHHQSIDIHGNYEGGGVCQNCQHNTTGINCEECKPGFYQPYGVQLDAIDVCKPCECDLHVSTGECEKGTGRCLCRPEYAGLNCDRCNVGYYGYPNCIPCECHINGTENEICTVATGNCPCKVNYDGKKCDMCALGYYNFPDCIACDCNPIGSIATSCDLDSGQCECRSEYGSRDCGACANGFFDYPNCRFCNCDPAGSVEEICDKEIGSCICKENFAGERCDQCDPGFFGFPNCQDCKCVSLGSRSSVCSESGQCQCKGNYAGLNCERCANGFYRYPDCTPCNCDLYGSLGASCDQTSGQCRCRDNFQGLRCEKCKENFYNYPVCEVCNCNPNGAKQIPGYPLGGCGIITIGLLCECKDRVQGHFCEQCMPGYWNLNRNNVYGCDECTCHFPGTLTGGNICNTETGQCMCKPDVAGRDCDQCRDGFYNLREYNPFGCTNCMCNMGGSQTPVCNKMSGQCICRPRVSGQKCDRPIKSHFYPDLHQLRFEIEDGLTPEGAHIRYGFDDYIFRDYSWRGYAILTNIQPEVLMEVDIRIPSLYQIIYRYVNRNDSPVRGDITLTPDSPTDVVQRGEIVFRPTVDPKFTRVTSGTVSTFVLNPGRWTISTKVPNTVFLDYFVLIPQDYYEASVLQQRITSPCQVPSDSGPCLHYQYPDLIGYSYVPGIDGYVNIEGQRQPVDPFPDKSITTDLGITGLAHLNKNQTSFMVDLVVPDPGLYVMVVTYHNPTTRSQELDVDLMSLTGQEKAKLLLNSCKYSTLCRQVMMTERGMLGVFNISTGYVILTFTGNEDVDIAIGNVTAIPFGEWTSEFIRPRIICIRINGICIPSTYSVPVGTVRVDFEMPPNQGRQTTDLPPNILNKNVGLIQLNSTDREIEICTSLSKPGQYVVLFHYYLSTEIGLTIPVTANVNGQTITGLFKPTYCPSVTGCRGTVLFDGKEVVSFSNINICIMVNSTQGRKIWLDYALIVPADRYSPFDLELEPIDKSIDFLNLCVDEGFVLKHDSQFCQDSVFTLTTEFNKGAVQCDCNADGSLNFNCQSFGGQCQCRDNVIGRTCSACRGGFYGFPRCKQCFCPFGLCHPVTGECVCPPRVEGEHCDRCKPESYGFDSLIGCQECNCHPSGVQDNDLNCDQTTGQCRCFENVGGRRCDTCLPGHHSFPYCESCDCDTRGTLTDICDQVTSQCLCKVNVVGHRCDQCADGMFHLSDEKPKGCTKCFCFGITTRCTSSNLNWDVVNTMDNWGVTNTIDGFVIEAGNTIAVKARDNIAESVNAIYWVAPPAYLSNKIHSYGGMLSFNVLFTLPRDSSEEAIGLVKPDVILMGNNMTVVHSHAQQPVPSTPLKMEVPLLEVNFRHAESGGIVSREQFMMVLINLQALHIRGSFFTLVDEIRLSDVSMDFSSLSGSGLTALTVEQCQCPPSYQGTSCQECAPGHYRSRSTPYLGICVKCNCNGHSTECDPVTGNCFNCQDNTTGPHCEYCLTGHFGDPTTGPCQICSCPLPLMSNNFATECVLAADGIRTLCNCLPGYSGPSCEICSPGHYGNPSEPGGYCQPCSCSGNIDVNDPISCDRSSGVCLRCLNNTAGERCQECRDWYWGDAVDRKDCKVCPCNGCGSRSCEKSSGSCQCKPNIIGSTCDQCAPYTWGFEYCDGCRDCNCKVGSLSYQCDLRTGVCQCQPGVQGIKCDRCQPGHWNLGSSGCQECDCLSDGAVGCDDQTGRCLCLPGVTGTKCDRCFDRWVLVPGHGCHECDYCIHLLLDDLDHLDRNVTTMRRQLAEVSVGVAAFQRLWHYNSSVMELKPRVAELYSLDRNEMQKMLDPLKQGIQALDASSRENNNKASQATFESDIILKNVNSLNKDSASLEFEIRGLVTLGEKAMQFVKTVMDQILASIQITNIETYISDVNRLLREVEAHNFSLRNDDIALELENAKAVLMASHSLGKQPETQINITALTSDEIRDIHRRLQDLQQKADPTTSTNALDILQRLRAQNVEAIKSAEDRINTIEDETDSFLGLSRSLLIQGQEELNQTTAALMKLGTQSSQMDGALQELLSHVDLLKEGIASVLPLVNQSDQHALTLENQALMLDNLYNGTRDQSANAVVAGQAFQNIVKLIKTADMNSQAALANATQALNESNGIVEELNESREKSNMLYVGAESAFNKTRTELFDRLTEAAIATDKCEEDNAEVNSSLALINSGLEEFIDASEREKSQNVSDRSDIAKRLADETEEQVNRYITLLPEDQHKLERIRFDRANASVALKTADSQLKDIQTYRTAVDVMLKNLSPNAKRLMDVGKTLDFNVKALRDKIELAREQANRIRVGLKFLGNTTLTAHNPSQLDQAGSYSQISLYFKSSKPDGLMLYVGSQNHLNDYLSLELNNGHLEYKYDLGTGLAHIVSSKPVNDGQWHHAVAQRIGKMGTLTVRTHEKEDDKIEGSSIGTSAVLELSQNTTKFFIGGLPQDAEVPAEVTRSFFVGSMEDLQFDDVPVGLWNFEKAENNLFGENARNVMKEVVTNGMRFNGMGYVVLSRSKLNLRPRKIEVQLQIQTYSENGLLLYMGDLKRDFLSIELKEGKVLFQFDNGGGRATLISNDRFNDGQWHLVSISRVDVNGLLLVDDKEVARNTSRGQMTELSTTNDIYLGGFDQIRVPTESVSNQGFDGCIQNVKFGTIVWDLNDNVRAEGVVQSCPAKITRVAIFDKIGVAGFVALKLSEPIGTKFDITFKIRTKENETLLVFAADNDQRNVFSVSVLNSTVVVSVSSGDSNFQLASKINVSDGAWHYISVMKMGAVLNMNIDDVEMLDSGERGVNNLFTETPIYFGGVPQDYVIKTGAAPTAVSLIGCIGDITVNNRFINLAVIPESDRIGASLIECPVKTKMEEEKKTTTLVISTTESISESFPDETPFQQCVLPPHPSLTENAEVTGVRFGFKPNSRQEFVRLPYNTSVRLESVFTVEFKTTSRNGLLFYLADKKHVDFLGLYLVDGRVHYGFNCGSGTGRVSSNQTFNDGQWHRVVCTRKQKDGSLEIDGKLIGLGMSTGRTLSINVDYPYFVGGLSAPVEKLASSNLGAGIASFQGCLRNLRLSNKEFNKPNQEIDVKPCSSAFETGAFFPASGGYIQLFDRFKVGNDLEIYVEVRPRSLSGVLLAVHGAMDFLVLQMVNGEIILSTDNGAGLITTKFSFAVQNYICDGKWHTIQANKNKNVVTLIVDGEEGPKEVGSAKVTAADTNDPLYIGGVPNISAKGILADGDYVGCIRNLHLNGKEYYLSSGVTSGEIMVDSCPVS